MGIYIKGYSYPETCQQCPCRDEDYDECIFNGQSASFTGHLQTCPLIPVQPHGRLIDADALTRMCQEMQSIEWNNKASPYSWAYAYESFDGDIDDAPTIIEAEE